MAINVSVQHSGGFLPGIILLTQCYNHWGTRLNAMKRFCICSLFFHLCRGCSEGLDADQNFILTTQSLGAFNFSLKHRKKKVTDQANSRCLRGVRVGEMGVQYT